MRFKLLTLVVVALAVAIALVACGGGGGSRGFTGSGTGLINTSVSDPATCAAPSGLFSRVIVTVARVRAHTSATAGDNDAGFVDLTPANMTPVQVDLLGTPTAQCFLAQLGTNVQIAAGTYQQPNAIACQQPMRHRKWRELRGAHLRRDHPPVESLHGSHYRH